MKAIHRTTLHVSVAFAALVALSSCKLGFSGAAGKASSTGSSNISFDEQNLVGRWVQRGKGDGKIILTWRRATNAIGKPLYEIFFGPATYLADDYVDALYDPKFEWTPPLDEYGLFVSANYLFSVGVQDNIGDLRPNNFVAVPVVDVYRTATDTTPPVFEGIGGAFAMSESRIQIAWNPVDPSADLSDYVVYNVADNGAVQELGRTVKNYYIVDRLSATQLLRPASSYRFCVEARDLSNNFSRTCATSRRSATTFSRSTTYFDGLGLAERMPATRGLTQLKLSWIAPPTTVKGFLVYMRSITRDDFGDFSTSFTQASPVGALTDLAGVGAYVSGTATNVVVDNLLPGTQYYFVVRSFTWDGTTAFPDGNRIVFGESTMAAVAPSGYTGVSQVIPAENESAYELVNVFWNAPPLNGVWDGFVVTYEEGTCAVPFTGTATQLSVTGEDVRSVPISIANAGNKTYRFKVNTRYSIGNVRDSNTTCRDVVLAPEPTDFAGITDAKRFDFANGFDKVRVTFKKPSRGAWQGYRVEFASDNAFTNILLTTPIRAKSLSDGEFITMDIEGLTPKTTYWVRASTVFTYQALSLINYGAAAPGIRRQVDTNPPPPTGEGLTEVMVVSEFQLAPKWTAPTNADATFSNYKLWYYCGIAAESNLQTLYANATGGTYVNDETTNRDGSNNITSRYGWKLYLSNAGLRDTIDVPSNMMCCFQLRGLYHDSTKPANDLVSASTKIAVCNQATLIAPSWPNEGNFTATVTNASGEGFRRINLNWTPVSVDFLERFSAYQIAYNTVGSGPENFDWTTTPVMDGNGFIIKGSVSLSNINTANYTLNGLRPNTTYYIRMRAANLRGSGAYAGGVSVATRMTTPQAPIEKDTPIPTIAAAGAESIRVIYDTPKRDGTKGLWNRVFFAVGKDSNTAADTCLAAFQRKDGGGAAPTMGITHRMGANKRVNLATLQNAGTPCALVSVDESLASPDAQNTYVFEGLPNKTHFFKVWSAYVEAESDYYLASNGSAANATPAVGTPTVPDVLTVTKANDATAFSQFLVTWGPITGDCTEVDVGISTDSVITVGSADFVNGYQNIGCSNPDPDQRPKSVAVVSGLLPQTNYWVVVRVINRVSGVEYVSQTEVPVTIRTEPQLPEGDNAVSDSDSPKPVAVEFAADIIEVDFSLPSNQTASAPALPAFYNKWYAWKATGNTAAADVAAKVNDAVNRRTTAMALTSGQITARRFIDSTVIAGLNTCYIIRAAYDNSTSIFALRQAYESEAICSQTPYSERTGYPEVTAVNLVAGDYWPDGTSKIELTLAAHSGSIDEYWVFTSRTAANGGYGFTTPTLGGQPWQKIPATSMANNKIIVGGQGNTIVGTNYFWVRPVYYGGPAADETDTPTTHRSVNVPGDRANLLVATSAATGLAYDMYVMAFEASAVSGSPSFGSGTVTTSEQKLQTCQANFLTTGTFNKLDGICFNGGSAPTLTSDANIASVRNAYPVKATFDEAWVACRNHSRNGIRYRLPTEEEWRRIARWSADAYSTLWSQGTGTVGGACNLSNTLATTGGVSNCKSFLGVDDLYGNVSEWVDTRVTRFSQPEGGPARYSYNPTLAKQVRNGIDNTSRLYHYLQPATGKVYGLLMGSDYRTDAASYIVKKSLGLDAEKWQETTVKTNSSGFRCVGFPESSLPTADAFLAPLEPVYETSDLPSGVPEGRFVGDTRPETVNIDAPGSRIQFTWNAWRKISSCDAIGCTTVRDDDLDYSIYRYEEPTRVDYRSGIQWGMSHGPYFNKLAPLDPFARTSSAPTTEFAADASIFKKVDLVGTSVCSAGVCTWNDSLNAAEQKRVFRYFLVAKRTVGSKTMVMPGVVQKFVSPYIQDRQSIGSIAFRSEMRSRLAGMLPLEATYQPTGNVAPIQVMRHVPMDLSGLDRDFFIGAYEASITAMTGAPFNSLVLADTSKPNVPVAATASVGIVTWQPNAGQCYEELLRTGVISSACGGNSTSNIVDSVYNAGRLYSPQPAAVGKMYSGTIFNDSPTRTYNINYGDNYKACANSYFQSGENNRYLLHVNTNAEWHAASLEGDTDHDGDIDVNPFASVIGMNVSNYEIACAETVNQASQRTGTNSACMSRYGVYDMVGGSTSAWDETADRVVYGVGLDNGIDGMFMDFPIATSATTGIFELLRGGLPTVGFSTIPFNLNYNTGILQAASSNVTTHVLRGGYGNSYSGMTPIGGNRGRYSIRTHVRTDGFDSGKNDQMALRCAYGR